MADRKLQLGEGTAVKLAQELITAARMLGYKAGECQPKMQNIGHFR
jgi:hypothetical protein